MLPSTLEELEALRAECKAMVTRRAGISAGAAVLPIPGLDLGTDLSLLVEMLPAINRRFGLTPEQIGGLDPHTKQIIFVATTGLGNTLIGRWVPRQLVTQTLQRLGVRVATKTVVKFVPIVGQALSASISFGAMKMLGNAHVDDCFEVAKKALLSLDPEQVRVIEVTPDMVEVAREAVD